MDQTATHSAYLKTLAITLGACCLGAAAINLAVDPYGMFGTPRIAGFNAVKPTAPERIIRTKPYFADRSAARTVIAGNSRPEAGLDPASPCWSEAQRPVFNAAVPGVSFMDQVRYLVHASAGGRVDQVLVALDLQDFLTQQGPAPDYASWPGAFSDLDRRLRTRIDGTPNPHYRWNQLKDWLNALFSLETLRDSAATLIRQREPDAPTRRADGFNPARDYLPIIHNEGQAVLFVQKNRELAERLGRPGQVLYQGDRHWSWDLETLERLLQLTERRDIAVTLFINPYHGDLLTAIAATGHWPQLEDWKRSLVAIADRHGVPLWDFHAFDETTMEPAPPRGDRTHTLRWFWEPAHYRAAYGERMLSAMLGRDCALDAPRAGIRLAPDNIEAHLAALRNGLEAAQRGGMTSPSRIGLK